MILILQSFQTNISSSEQNKNEYHFPHFHFLFSLYCSSHVLFFLFLFFFSNNFALYIFLEHRPMYYTHLYACWMYITLYKFSFVQLYVHLYDTKGVLIFTLTFCCTLMCACTIMIWNLITTNVTFEDTWSVLLYISNIFHIDFII